LDRYLDLTENEWKVSDAAKRRQNAPLSLGHPFPTLLKTPICVGKPCWDSYSTQGYQVHAILSPDRLSPCSRFWRAEHVLETNLCLHRIYGIPILPGSAVKGVTRAVAFWEIAERLEVPVIDLEEARQRKQDKIKTPLQLLDDLLSCGKRPTQTNALDMLKQEILCRNVAPIQSLTPAAWQATAKTFDQVFGTTERQGQVLFFDSYPTSTPKLKLDILNPHYGKYYMASQG